jgi:hypothetical protein
MKQMGEIVATGLGSDGALILAEALKVNKSLQYLNLCSNNLNEKGAIAIIQTLKQNSIAQLNLGENNLGLSFQLSLF